MANYTYSCGICGNYITGCHPLCTRKRLEDAEATIRHIAAMCGNPDPAEGCRLILARIREWEVQGGLNTVMDRHGDTLRRLSE